MAFSLGVSLLLAPLELSQGLVDGLIRRHELYCYSLEVLDYVSNE